MPQAFKPARSHTSAIDIDAALPSGLLAEVSAACDGAIVIAPEFDGHLLRAARELEARRVTLLSPGAEFIALASDKQRTAELLLAAGVPAPRGSLLDSPRDLEHRPPPIPFPALLKPNDGAGSLGVRRIERASEFPPLRETAAPWRMEEMIAGRPASVAVLCGANPLACPPFYQRLSGDGSFSYLGGERITDQTLARRARELTLQALAAMPATVGYVGVDLILGPQADGSGDRVIEVNPRLTTSYVGLRRLARSNLAAAMLAVAAGEAAELSWTEEPIQFEADGTTFT